MTSLQKALPQHPAATHGDAAGQWWRKPFDMVQTNLREINADMDVEKVLDFIQAHGADAWLIGTGGILSFYPTDLPFETRNPHLAKRASGDLIGDAIKAAHGRGVRLLSRMDFSKTTARVAAEHPDWCFLSPTGQLQTHTDGLVSVCPSGPYYQEKVFEILDEITTRYPVDGFFFNWFSYNEVDYWKVYQGVCHCANCHTRFKDFTGLSELPDGPSSPNYSEWLVFAADTINNITARIRTFIAGKLPNAGLISGTAADLIYLEANNALGRDLWHHATGERVSAYRTHRTSVPVLVNSTAFFDMPYRMASEEADHHNQYFVQAISRGGNISTYIMGVPGQIPYACLDTAGEIHRFHKKWRAVYDGMMPCARTALVRPSRLDQTAAQFEDAMVEFRGLYLALQERHVPFDVMGLENIAKVVDNGGLGRYALIVLPDLGSLPEAAVTTLDKFVSKGGRLLATGSSGLTGDNVQLKSLPAVKRTKAITERKQLWSSYVCPIMDPNGDPWVYPGPVVPLYGAYHFFEWKPEAQHHLRMLAQAPFAPPEKAYGNVQVNEPGYVIGSFEQGQAAMIPWAVGRAYRDLGLTVVREMFLDVVTKLLAKDEPLSAELPHQVEITVNRNGEKTIVHVINMSGKGHSNFGTHLPIRGGVLRFAHAGSKATAHALVADASCEVRQEQGSAVITLPELGLFEVIVITTE